MKNILNFGSMNIDYVYNIGSFAQPGETISSRSLLVNCGGKGLNQSVALARAGAKVYHAGKIGKDGVFLRQYLEDCGVDTSYIELSDETTGHAIIQVDSSGENSILLYGGTNHTISREQIDRTLAGFGEGDFLLLQNEINDIPYIMQAAWKKKMRIYINPAPMNETAYNYPLELAECMFLNEIESCQLAHAGTVEAAMDILTGRYPDCMFVFTLGKHGAVCRWKRKSCSHGIYDVKVVDTTAAGDTFTGFFMEELAEEHSVEDALRLASIASSLSVTREGASKSIPTKEEVLGSKLN